MKLASTHQAFLVRSMGKVFRVTAIFHDDKEANAYMEKNPDEAVMACFGPYILIANKYKEET